PLLVAAAATLVVARVLPPVLRALSRAARSRRGLVPVVATARASAAAGTAIPLLTLTVAVGLVVFCGTTLLTVQAGQITAAGSRVGADVRVEGPLTAQDVTDLRAQPGVTAVAGAAVLGGRTLGAGSGTTVDVVLVDADALATIEAAHGRPDADLRLLTRGENPSALVSPSIRAAVDLVTPDLMTNSGRITLDVVGTVGDEPRVASDSTDVDGRVLVDRATFDATQEATTDPSTILVDGPGALAATRALHLADRTEVTVMSLDGWLDDWRHAPLNRDLIVLLLGTSIALAAYAALALVLMVAATSRERGRSLSALRTLGLDARTASTLTFAELAPLAVAAVVGGTAIGILIPWLTSGALGLELVTGGYGPPALRVGWWPVVGACAVVAVALVVTVLVEGAVRRRDRLGEVLRVGER
ncbi:MAG TPA: FtsX-like permease family protein, partial [Cellulomonas sp.]|nr:FtsX-like permease family protein [Cellulomonas sp.]